MSDPAPSWRFHSTIRDLITKPHQHDLLRLFQTALNLLYKPLSTPKTLIH